MRRPFLLVTVAVLATVLTSRAQQILPSAAPASIGLAPEPLGEASALLRQYVADGKIAGAVAAVARQGSVGYLEAVGVQDLQTKAPMTPRSLFRIYSMAKPVTAVAVMMLHEEGKFQLDDPVSKYLPEFADVKVVDAPGATPRAPVRAITVEDLLLHTSGLSHRTSDLYRTLGVRIARRHAAGVHRQDHAGAADGGPAHVRFRYSEATTVLGRLVEIWSGQPFDEFLQTPPLHAARHDRHRVLGAARAARSPGHGVRTGTGRRWPRPVEIEAVPFTERPALLEGAVGLVSTVPDYLRFSQMLLEGGALGGVRVLRAETVARMTANGLPADVQAARGGAMGWGLANVNVLLDPGASGASRGEYGWDGTAGTIFWVDPLKRDGHRPDDAELAGQPRLAASALQSDRPARDHLTDLGTTWPVGGVAQAVAQQREAEHRRGDRHAGRDGAERRRAHQLAAAAEHRAPFRHRAAARRGRGTTVPRRAGWRCPASRWRAPRSARGTRQHVPPQDPRVGRARGACGEHEVGRARSAARRLGRCARSSAPRRPPPPRRWRRVPRPSTVMAAMASSSSGSASRMSTNCIAASVDRVRDATPPASPMQRADHQARRPWPRARCPATRARRRSAGSACRARDGRCRADVPASCGR